MADKDFERQVAELEKLTGDPSSQTDLGSRLVREVAKAVMAERRGEEIGAPDVELAIRKGDVVPAQFQDRVRTDEAGRALQDVTIQSQNLIIWLRVWIRFWLRILAPFELRTTPLNGFEDFNERVSFSTDELEMFDRLRKITG